MQKISKWVRQFSLSGVTLWYFSITSFKDVEWRLTLSKFWSILWETITSAWFEKIMCLGILLDSSEMQMSRVEVSYNGDRI